MEKFDPNGWDYSNHQKQFKKLVKCLFPDQNLNLEEVRKNEGGKGVSLLLAQQIRKAFLSDSVIIPPHIFVTQHDSAESFVKRAGRWAKKADGWICRSSEPDEDWIEPACGLHQSYRRMDRYHGAVRDLREDLPGILNHTKTGVLQPFHLGTGYVVDFAYSRVLEQPVVSIAAGTGFNSATNDTRADHWVFDFHGKLILTSYWKGEAPESIGRLLKLLLPLKNLPIWFGFQLELIKHEHPLEEREHLGPYLVSFRPSPAPLRGLDETAKSQGELILKTPLVSHAGSTRGRCRYLPGYDMIGEHSLESKCRKAGIPSSSLEPKILDNQIVLWEGIAYDINSRLHTLVGAARLGAKAQMCRTPVFTCTIHVEFQALKRHQLEQIENLQGCCIFVGLTDKQLEIIKNKYFYADGFHKNASDQSLTFEVISDGLVAAIYEV